MALSPDRILVVFLRIGIITFEPSLDIYLLLVLLPC